MALCKVSEWRSGTVTSMDMTEYLEEGVVQKLIDNAPSLQKRHFLPVCMRAL